MDAQHFLESLLLKPRHSQVKEARICPSARQIYASDSYRPSVTSTNTNVSTPNLPETSHRLLENAQRKLKLLKKTSQVSWLQMVRILMEFSTNCILNEVGTI